MAIIKPSHLIGAISGSIGSVTFKNTRNGTVLATRPNKRAAKSEAQIASDARWFNLSLAWKALTPQQRHAWNSFARNLSRSDSLALPRAPSGFQTFMAHNSIPYWKGLSLILVPPPNTQLPPPISPSAGFQVSGFYYISVVIPGPLSPVYLVTEGCRTTRTETIRTGKFNPPYPLWPFNRWRTLQVTSFAYGPQTDNITNAWGTKLGTCVLNEFFACRVSLWHPTALRSPRIVAASLVGA